MENEQKYILLYIDLCQLDTNYISYIEILLICVLVLSCLPFFVFTKTKRLKLSVKVAGVVSGFLSPSKPTPNSSAKM